MRQGGAVAPAEARAQQVEPAGGRAAAAVKTEEQQSRLMVHRARQGYVNARTIVINRIRGLLQSRFDCINDGCSFRRTRFRSSLQRLSLVGDATLVICFNTS